MSSNPLLTKLKIPGETFRLPSQGLFYNDGELEDDVVNGELHIYPMTTHDELVFKSPDMLFSGKAIDDVFSRCIPQIKKPRQLLSKDVDFLLTCLRLITYGPVISVTYNHGCTDGKEHTYEIPLRPIIQQARSIDPTILNTSCSIKLENGQIVNIKPSTYGSVMELSQTFDVADPTSISLDVISKSLSEVVVDMISSVDSISDKALIREWFNHLSAGWARQISDGFSALSNWGVQLEQTTMCKDCNESIKLEFSTNPISFFS